MIDKKLIDKYEAIVDILKNYVICVGQVLLDSDYDRRGGLDQTVGQWAVCI